MEDEQFPQYFFIIAFLSDPYLQYSILPHFSSKYYELLKFLFDKFYFADLSGMEY